MKKLIFVFVAAMFLVACQSNSSTPSNENVTNDEETTNENQHENNLNNNEENEETTIEKNESNNETENDESEENNENTNNDEGNKEVEDELTQLGEKIFQAQFDKDISFLESVLSEGSTIEGETFYFDDVSYPHEQEFFTEETAADLEFRYTHENDETSYIVGFAAIDEVEEFSFVIDFEFILENDEWKMNDMDVNK